MAKSDAAVLITSTQPRAEKFVYDLQSDGMEALACPALLVQTVETPMPQGEFDAMLITSSHVLHTSLPLHLPAIAIGEETARQAQDMGLDITQTGYDNLQSMDLSAYTSILYPCAMQPSLIPPHTTPWALYHTIANPEFTIPPATEIICLFSVKGAQAVKPHCRRDHTILCLSQAIADVFDNHPIDNLAVCARPRYDTMKELIKKRVYAHDAYRRNERCRKTD